MQFRNLFFILAFLHLPIVVLCDGKGGKGKSEGGKGKGEGKGKGGKKINSSSKSKGKGKGKGGGGAARADYEVWGSDQSNSVPGQTSLGVKGSFLWIWDRKDILDQISGKIDNAPPLPCTPNDMVGPCDLMDIFPQTSLEEYDANDMATGKLLDDLPQFGRLHGVIADPQQRYVNANIFAPGGGYVGVIDTRTKEAVGLFRVTEFQFDTNTPGQTVTTRSVHMSFWSNNGDAIYVANLNGKAVERINVIRDDHGDIIDLQFDRSATIGLGKGMVVVNEATYFQGNNAFGNPLVGGIIGNYANADLRDTTPNGVCKENGCAGTPAALGGRANNVPICPIPSSNNLIYTTLGGDGLLVVDGNTTPMTIRGEYGNNVVYGAGCGGVESGGKLYTNSGVSASGAGLTQSMFAVWQFDDSAFMKSGMNGENDPKPILLFEDPGNTLTGGNMVGTKTEDLTGQIPGITTRRDSHGAAATVNGKFLHVVDRIQNVMEVFNLRNFRRGTYDLTSKNGEGRGVGGCMARSITDGSDLLLNDPAPDLFERSPDGEFMFIAFRGPAPVSVPHAGQGSCPGVGIVKLNRNGSSGRLVDVLRSTNMVEDEFDAFAAPGGVVYSGNERSDVHGAIVVDKTKW